MMAVIGCAVVLAFGIFLLVCGFGTLSACALFGASGSDRAGGFVLLIMGAGCVYASYSMSPFELVARAAS